MASFMAGATRTGARVARKRVVRKSSATPPANLPMTLAVAGATQRSEISLASATCRIVRVSGSSKRSTIVRVPARLLKSRGEMSRAALGVMTTRTSTPAFWNPRRTSQAL